MKLSMKGLCTAALLSATATSVTAEDISLRIGSGLPQGVVYVDLMINFFSGGAEKPHRRTDRPYNQFCRRVSRFYR